MAHHLRAAITRVKVQLRHRLPVDVDQLARQAGHRWRDRTLTPSVTIWLFLLQILHGNVAMTALRHLGGLSMQASSYCCARGRLPLALFLRLFDAIAQAAADAGQAAADAGQAAAVAGQAGADATATTLLQGRRVLLGDATTFSTPDTKPLRAHFGYPPGQRDGCGFPMGKLLGVLDAVSGTVACALGCPLFTHEAREMLTLHPLLKKGDILVADRGFCSYVQIALLMRHGVDVVMRLHQRRPTQWAKDSLVRWTRPVKRPDWMNPALFASLPQQLTIRLVRYAVPRRGCRTRHVYVASTLLDERAYPPRTIMHLYGHRWNIETCFNQLKTHAGMSRLKSRSVEGVVKELIMYLIVWNLVRMTMAKFAQAAGVNPWRVSFLDAMRALAVMLRGERPQDQWPSRLRLLVNPDRPGRWEPRKLKRRLKEYDLLNEPRPNLKAKHAARYA